MKLVLLILLMVHVNKNSADVDSSQISSSDENSDIDLFSKCYDGLGCLDTDARWYDKKYRPVNLRPADRHIIKTDFLLIKPSREETDNLVYTSFGAKDKNIQTSGFHLKSEVIILIHDFTANGYTGWIKHVAYTIFVNALDINVVSVDWQRGAEPPYDQAVANARVVALEIIRLIREMKNKFKYNISNIHLVGHGIGAHIAGYVGAAVEGVKMITGLDPSGPRFEGMPDIVKLNPTNAKYVEVIHTDASDSRSLGTREPMGHSDYYVNNANAQLGCKVNKSFPHVLSVDKTSLGQGEILPSCSHKRSFKYFIEAMENRNCTFLGLLCDSFENFTMGRCISCGSKEGDCRIFGSKSYKSPQQKNTYFLNVGERPPFCMFQYKVEINVKDVKEFNGYFDLILMDDEGHVSEATVATEPRFRTIRSGNNTFVFFAQSPGMKKITEMKVRWNEKKKFYCFIYCKQRINVDRITVLLLQKTTEDFRPTNVLCPADGETVIENGAYRKFIQCSPSKSTSTAKPDTSSYETTTSTTRKEETETYVAEETTKKHVSQHQKKSTVGPMEPVAGIAYHKTKM